MSIYYGTRDFGTLRFTEPEPLITSLPPSDSGLYVVLVRDAAWGPRPFRAPYFGQSKELDERGFPFQHHAVRKWLARGESIFSLWIAWCSMPLSSAWDREEIEDQLIDRYQPELNERLNRSRATTANWNPYVHPLQTQAQPGGLFGLGALAAPEPRPASTEGLGAFADAWRRPTTPLGSVSAETGIGAFGPVPGPGLLNDWSWWPAAEKPWWR